MGFRRIKKTPTPNPNIGETGFGESGRYPFRPSNQLAPMSTRPTNQLAPLVDQLAPTRPRWGELVSALWRNCYIRFFSQEYEPHYTVKNDKM